MGACASSSTAEDRMNKKIAQEQAAAAKDDERHVKLLLLGSGDSGKTTLRKQMRSLYGAGFSESDLRMNIPVIFGNIVEGCVAILGALDEVGESLQSDEARAAGALLTSMPASSHAKVEMNDELARVIQILWKDEGFQRTRDKRSAFQLQDCWDDFAQSLATSYPQWGGPNWLPTTAECISVRIRTSGVLEEDFTIEKLKFKLFDVGGQRAERRKWITCFDNVTAVIWVSAISDYDQTLFEDNSKNRLEESVELFSSTINNSAFIGIPIMIFLNKRDLFEKKFVENGIPLNVSGLFPDAPAGNDIDKALAWFKHLFLSKIEDQERVYVYTTCAKDPGNVKTVFDTCRQIIITKSLEASGFTGHL